MKRLLLSLKEGQSNQKLSPSQWKQKSTDFVRQPGCLEDLKTHVHVHHLVTHDHVVLVTHDHVILVTHVTNGINRLL